MDFWLRSADGRRSYQPRYIAVRVDGGNGQFEICDSAHLEVVSSPKLKTTHFSVADRNILGNGILSRPFTETQSCH